jgi:DnaK suppressor protein
LLTDLGRYSELSADTEQERSGDLTIAPLHDADLGTDAMRVELDAANAARETSELEEIDAALDRLYRAPERFGICEDTGNDIPFERLDIIPWARTCDRAESE